ncbi:aromatic acid exporter family protein [Enterococcus sp. CWB-B31]|uniref:aromatic acid exporter family protein n=1 Tax=Enterococcus sp. CWB-B31 TaxID=2885159 RepID=UPI001E4D6399|nr:aromatic acid exporter family protein [Enterococcus sp. CWB-B31]MCB5955132.1 aromatic acid exporter family protein [Enterococcus sp. CWB-B31]
MKIGLRTVKTAFSAAVSIVLASGLGLLNPASAGIISVLSVTATKRSSFLTGIYRLLSLALATGIAFLCFYILGFTPWAFGIYLLLFIPAAVSLNLSDGIVVSSVLVTHYLIAGYITWELIANEFLLMIIGVGMALLMNLYMPDVEKRLKEDQEVIEAVFRKILHDMAMYLNENQKERSLFARCDDLKSLINEGQDWAKNHAENQLLSKDSYYLDYFTMRRIQSTILKDMLRLLERVIVEPEQVKNIQELLAYTSQTFSEANDGREILDRIRAVYEIYREKPLPVSRKEFENRAELFQFLQLFYSFIEVKEEFAKDNLNKINGNNREEG